MAEYIITTVIPTFRRPVLLKRAIESVLAQSFKDLVVCVYDNASGDETEEIVKLIAERDSRVHYFKNDQNIGAVANILQGINAVKTPYYSLLSDDDFLLPSFYENAVEAYKSFPNTGFVCAKTIVVDLIDKKLQFRNQDWQSGFYEPSNEIVSKMYSSHFVTTSVLLNVKVRDAIGVFEPSGSDSLYMTIAAAIYPFVVLDNYGAAVTLHESAYSLIGGGIVKESVSTLYGYLLKTINCVMILNIPDERKIHLLMCILKSYQQHFDTKKLNYLINKNQENGLENILLLPSLITNRGLATKFHAIFPLKIYAFLTLKYNLMGLLKRIKHRLQGNAWVDLPKGASTLLDENNTDVSKLMPYFQPKD